MDGFLHLLAARSCPSGCCAPLVLHGLLLASAAAAHSLQRRTTQLEANGPLEQTHGQEPTETLSRTSDGNCTLRRLQPHSRTRRQPDAHSSVAAGSSPASNLVAAQRLRDKC